MKTETLSLKDQWAALLSTEPKLRIRDAATKLGVTEVELLATRCGGEGVTRLEGNFNEFVKELPRLGEIMCLTRNEHAVHERYGKFENPIEFFANGGIGQVQGPDIDLRLFMKHWTVGFAVTDETDEGPRYSFQFFDTDGTAVHKIYVQAEGDYAVYNELATQYRSENQSTEQATIPKAAAEVERPDSEADLAGFHAAWLEMKETHDFFMLLRKFGLSRIQGLRLAPEGYATKVDKSITRTLLETAAKNQLPIMVFISSEGVIQIHTGEVKNIKMFGQEWLNVLDDRFNMHLRETGVESAWIVRKPTRDGEVTSLELFDANGENIILFFGKRKPGQLEDENWRTLVKSFLP
ncbi:MAG: ChuX/HutX family heme-like substrate-binding protein [Chthoniobacterales bacterium]